MDPDAPPCAQPEPLTGVAADALIEEYKSLREEILRRCQFQLLIITVTVAIASAFIPLAARYSSEQHLTVLFAAPLIFSATTWLYFEQDIFITQAATYLNTGLAPALRARLPADVGGVVMQWEVHRHEMLFVDRTANGLVTAMFWVRLVAVLGFGVAALAVAIFVAIDESPGDSLHWYDYLLAVIDVAAIAALSWLSRYVRKLYAKIDERADEDAGRLRGAQDAPAGV